MPNLKSEKEFTEAIGEVKDNNLLEFITKVAGIITAEYKCPEGKEFGCQLLEDRMFEINKLGTDGHKMVIKCHEWIFYKRGVDKEGNPGTYPIHRYAIIPSEVSIKNMFKCYTDMRKLIALHREELFYQ